MKSLDSMQLQLASNLQSLPAEQIKAAILHLLASENIDSIDWKHALSSEVTAFQEWIKQRRQDSSDCSDFQLPLLPLSPIDFQHSKSNVETYF